MATARRIAASFLLALPVLAACEVFEDPTPERIFFKLEGDASTQVELVYSKEFVAGVDEAGVTQVRIFHADTVRRSLPVDTVIDIGSDARLFIQAAPVGAASSTVRVRVDVDDRNVVEDTGDLLASTPWRYVYLFNQQLTRVVDVVF